MLAIPKRAKKHTTKAGEKTTVSKTKVLNTPGLDKLSSLPPDCFDIIVDSITDPSTISALSRTSRGFYTLMAPRLYRRVAVAAMFHAHIAKLIRTLEPHLTIEQKRQLKKEGKYRGQQERYPAGHDAKKLPACAGHVQELIIGASDPGKNHRYIVLRYYEEALKNMRNLKTVQTRVVSESISEGIASLANLKALSVYVGVSNVTADDMAPLAHVKNLKHLHFQSGREGLAVCQSMIRNSMSTLQSLNMLTYYTPRHCFNDWQKNLKSSGHDTTSSADKASDLAALRSLHIAGLTVDDEFIKVFPQVIDFSKLRELFVEGSRDRQFLLWPFLTRLITSYKLSYTPICLRTLLIDMHNPRSPHEPEQRFAAKCSFIASFDTLTTLTLHGYGQYATNRGLTNPGLADTLLQAILKHKNLETLQISYNGIISGLRTPYLGAKSIGDIVDGLPQLREFEFAPDEAQMDEIGRALCRGKSLETVTCFPYESWHTQRALRDILGINVLSSILSAYLSNTKVGIGCRNLVWDDHYKLNRLNVIPKAWDIGSKLGKGGKGYGKPEKFQVDVQDGTREVWHQLVSLTRSIHVGYDPSFEWVTKVQREMM